jgi:hypothetical protein
MRELERAMGVEPTTFVPERCDRRLKGRRRRDRRPQCARQGRASEARAAVSDKLFGDDPALAPMYKKMLETAKKCENEKDPS